MIEVYVDGLQVVPGTEEHRVVMCELNPTPKPNLGEIIPNHHVTLRCNEHTKTIRLAIITEFALVPIPFFHLDPGPARIVSLLISVVAGWRFSEVFYFKALKELVAFRYMLLYHVVNKFEVLFRGRDCM